MRINLVLFGQFDHTASTMYYNKMAVKCTSSIVLPPCFDLNNGLDQLEDQHGEVADGFGGAQPI